MALPPLPANSTNRLFLDYTSRGLGHTLILRFNEVATVADALIVTDLLRTELRDLMLTSDSFTGARWAVKGSDLTFPTGLLPLPGFSTNPSDEVDPESFFFSWTGRGTITGRKVSYKFYGTRGGGSRAPMNRYPPGNFGTVDQVAAALQAIADSSQQNGELVSIGEDRVYINSYTNCANSAYWQRAQRG